MSHFVPFCSTNIAKPSPGTRAYMICISQGSKRKSTSQELRVFVSDVECGHVGPLFFALVFEVFVGPASRAGLQVGPASRAGLQVGPASRAGRQGASKCSIRSWVEPGPARHAALTRRRIVPPSSVLTPTVQKQKKAELQFRTPKEKPCGRKVSSQFHALQNRFTRLAASRSGPYLSCLAVAVRQSSEEPVELESPRERFCEQCGSRHLECVPLPKARNTS